MVPHDIYLGRTADEGLISSLILAAFAFFIFRAFLVKWRADPQYPWFNRDFLGLVAGIMTCYFVGGMSIDYRYFDLINVIFFFLAGLVYGYRNEEFGLTGKQQIVYVNPDVRAGDL
jgi:O-antigen ligase